MQLIGAKALVTEGTEIPDGPMVLGAPAKVVRQLSETHLERMHEGARDYVKKWQRYARDLRPC